MSFFSNSLNEPKWTGAREVMAMSGPIILGSLSYTVMGFADRVMVGRLSGDALAAVLSADIAAFTLCTLFMGVTGVVGTFAAQCYGRGDRAQCAHYCWQGIHLSLAGILFAALLWPLSGPLFGLMRHTPEVTALELVYFRIRLFGYYFIAVMAALTGFFQAVDRPGVPMYTAIIGNGANLLLNYVLIFGKLGFPAMGIAGAATATVLAMALQTGLLLAVFLSGRFNREYGSRRAWAVDLPRIRELVRIGVPAAMSMFLDVANWWIWISFIIGRFGPVQMAANTTALSFNHICFMPVIGLHQGISAIVGQWIGRGDLVRAKARTFTAIKISMGYMVFMGAFFAVFGGVLIRLFFRPDPEIVLLGHRLLILAAFFQAFDAVNIICMGALRGAGDTRWMMWMTAFMSYGFCLPLSIFFAFVLGLETYGAWMGATLFIMVLSGVLFHRFNSGQWRHIQIFTQADAPQ
ncbi:MAG: MATE family efflux transporter [Candidatus Hydrogenedens sp.]|nr:MATE family efflux transporter [Candidatus Hydrogenedentota bacterium]NLF57937.1 MATE family efflux transporter [Candidatus Hydrogenedens sp.]